MTRLSDSNAPAVFLAALFFALHVGIGVWDFIAVQRGHPRNTVSFIVREWGEGNLLFVLVVGVVLGHVFGPVRQYPVLTTDTAVVTSARAEDASGDSAVVAVSRIGGFAPLVVLLVVVLWFFIWRWSNGGSHS